MQVLRAAAVVLALLVSAGAMAQTVDLPKVRGASGELLPEQKGPKRVIRFLTSPDYPPFQFLKPDQSPAGFNVDLARALCAELDYSCTIQALPWNELIDALQNGRADALVAGLRPSADLRGKADLTRPYFRLPARFAVANDKAGEAVSPAAVAGKRVAVVAGSAHEAYLKAFFPSAQLEGFPDLAAARAALKEGKADAVFADAATLSLWLAGTESGDCCAFAGGPFLESHFFGEGLVIAVRKGETQLRQDLDRTLDEIEEKGTVTDLYLRWFPLGIF